MSQPRDYHRYDNDVYAYYIISTSTITTILLSTSTTMNGRFQTSAIWNVLRAQGRVRSLMTRTTTSLGFRV